MCGGMIPRLNRNSPPGLALDLERKAEAGEHVAAHQSGYGGLHHADLLREIRLGDASLQEEC